MILIDIATGELFFTDRKGALLLFRDRLSIRHIYKMDYADLTDLIVQGIIQFKNTRNMYWMLGYKGKKGSSYHVWIPEYYRKSPAIIAHLTLQKLSQ